MTQYKDIPQFPGYRVGDDGSVWSCRKCREYKWGEWRQLNPGIERYGYKHVNLMRDGTPILRMVHHLVLEAFVGPKPPDHEALHHDNNPSNNALNNLSWGTKTENGIDVRINGKKKGEHHHNAKLTDELIRQIRERYVAGETQKAIAISLGVHQSSISLALTGKQWSHVA